MIRVRIQHKHNGSDEDRLVSAWTEGVLHDIPKYLPSVHAIATTNLMMKARGMQDYEYTDEILRAIAIQMAVDWKQVNGSIMSCVAAVYTPDLQPLFEDITASMWERACAIDWCWSAMTSKDGREGDTCLDAIIKLSKHEKFAKMFSESRLIVQSLILKLRCRTSMHTRLDLVVYNLLKYHAFDAKYYRDLCLTLMSLLEFNRKYKQVLIISNFASTTVFDTVVKSLKLLFDIPEFELVDKKLQKKCTCAHCHSLLKLPQKLNCKHKFCYVCVVNNKTDDRTFECPVCGKHTVCSGLFIRSDERYDYVSMNAINSASVTIKTPSPFTGTSQQLWTLLKNDQSLQQRAQQMNLKPQFAYFCDYMIKDTKIRVVAHEKELRNQSRVLRMQGNEYFKQKQYAQAIECYEQALKICPNIYSEDRCLYFSNLAIAYLKLDDYLHAYESCLSGLAQNCEQVKLLHALYRCYSELSMKQIFSGSMDVGDEYLEQVQTVILSDFYVAFNSKYLKLKFKKDQGEFKKDQDVTAEYEDLIRRKFKQFREEDSFAKSLSEESGHYLMKSAYLNHFFEKYRDAYATFKEERNNAKREMLDFVVYVLQNKEEFWHSDTEEAANEEWILAEDVLSVVIERLCNYLGNSLVDVEKNETSNQLVSGFSFDASQSRQTPVDVLELIHEFVFHIPQFNYYEISVRQLLKLVRKTDRVILSSEVIVERKHSRLGGYGLKLSPDVIDMDGEEKISDYDSGLEEFRANSNV